MTRFVFSLHPGPAAAIYDGSKRFEFRRGRVNVAPGDRVLIYETKPVGKVTGMFIVANVHRGPPAKVLELADAQTRAVAERYLAGAAMATAFGIEDAERFDPPRDLPGLGLERAPQSYARIP